jgi:hypothetical protein
MSNRSLGAGPGPKSAQACESAGILTLANGLLLRELGTFKIGMVEKHGMLRTGKVRVVWDAEGPLTMRHTETGRFQFLKWVIESSGCWFARRWW